MINTRVLQVHKVATILILSLLLLGLLKVPTASSVTQRDIDNAIEKALAYLASNQDESGFFKESKYNSIIASTALAVLSFENFGHFATNDPEDDPYATVVTKGLEYLVSKVKRMTIGSEPAGNPDTNGNGYGAYWDSEDDGADRSVYETPMVTMAIVASGTPNKNITSGPYQNTTYRFLVTDAVDWLVAAQVSTESQYRGGWRYSFNSKDSDNSVSQWPAIALRAAEYWGVYAPEFVKSELWHWIENSQDMDPSSSTYGGFWYQPGSLPNDGVATTGAGICQLDYAGANSSNYRVQQALLYLNEVWSSSKNMGFPYAMYAVMKGCRDAIPPIPAIGGHDWYNEYAEWLVQNQQPDGTWSSTAQGGPMLNTEFGLLVLSKALIFGHYTVTLVVTDEVGSALENATLTLDTPDNQTVSNSDGISVFKNVPKGNHTFTASKTGYNLVSITRDISEDTIITFTLEAPEPYTVTVEVCDEYGSALSDAAILLGANSKQTNPDGKTVFANISRGNCSITASKTGFDAISVTQHIYKNTTIMLVLYSEQLPTDSLKDALQLYGLAALIVANCIVGLLYVKTRRTLNKLRKNKGRPTTKVPARSS